GIERLLDAPAAATAGDAARTEAVDGKSHVPPGTQPIGDPDVMPGNAGTAVQYNNRRQLSRQTGIRSRQVADKPRRRQSRKVWNCDQGVGRGGVGTEQ